MECHLIIQCTELNAKLKDILQGANELDLNHFKKLHSDTQFIQTVSPYWLTFACQFPQLRDSVSEVISKNEDNTQKMQFILLKLEQLVSKVTSQEFISAVQKILELYKEYPNSDSPLEELVSKAAQGYAEAQYQLGYRYEYGKGVPRNILKALELYTKASDQGHALARYFKENIRH